MTWRDEIKRACALVGQAEAERERVLRAAHDAGFSTREIAKVAGATHSTVWRWMGGKDAPPRVVSIDSEADLDGTLRAAAEYLTSPDESSLRESSGGKSRRAER